MAEFTFFNDPEAMLCRLFYKENCEDKNKQIWQSHNYSAWLSERLIVKYLIDKQGRAEGRE